MLLRCKNTRAKLTRSLLFSALALLPTLTWGLDDLRLNALKAAYIYNFTKFIDWQQRPTDGFRICLNTENKSLIDEFKKIEQKGPKVVVLNDYLDDSNFWKDCQIIYLETPLQAADKKAIEFPNTLLVSEVKSESDHIRFVLINNKLRFSIGKDRAERAGLSISSKLLRLAHEVY